MKTTFKNKKDMKFTEEEIAQVRNDKMLRNLANLFGVDFDKVLEEAIEDMEKMEESKAPEAPASERAARAGPARIRGRAGDASAQAEG